MNNQIRGDKNEITLLLRQPRSGETYCEYAGQGALKRILLLDGTLPLGRRTIPMMPRSYT